MPENSNAAITITWDPDLDLVARQFIAWGATLGSFKTPLRRAVEKVVSPSIQQNFESGGRPAWQPLSDMTEQIKSSKGYASGRPLIASGALEAAASSADSWTYSEESASLDQLGDAWYGIIHNEGGGWNNIPQRQWAVIQDSDQRQLDDVFLDWVEEMGVAAGVAGTGVSSGE